MQNDANQTVGSRLQVYGSVWKKIYLNNKGALLILLAEVVASSMDAIVRFLQQGGRGIHPFQVIFARMSGTFVLSTIYMWWTQVPDFPLGNRNVRTLLTVRALFGFFGLWCLYCQVFSRKDLGAALVALVGVVIIAHPAVIFDHKADKTNTGNKIDKVTPAQRLVAIAVSVLGVLGASGAYTMIRVIGDRAHALMSVNYFAIVSTVGSTAILLITPGIGFTRPQSAQEWALLAILGVGGFILQFLLTAGLQLDKSSKATSMLYTQILFALLFDWSIWGVLPDSWGLVGGGMVIASTLWSALQKPQKVAKDASHVDEESALLGDEAIEQAAERRASVTA